MSNLSPLYILEYFVCSVHYNTRCGTNSCIYQIIKTTTEKEQKPTIINGLSNMLKNIKVIDECMKVILVSFLQKTNNIIALCEVMLKNILKSILVLII